MAFIRWIHGQPLRKHRLVSHEKDVGPSRLVYVGLYVDGLRARYHPGILDTDRNDCGLGWRRFSN